MTEMSNDGLDMDSDTATDISGAEAEDGLTPEQRHANWLAMRRALDPTFAELEQVNAKLDRVVAFIDELEQGMEELRKEASKHPILKNLMPFGVKR